MTEQWLHVGSGSPVGTAVVDEANLRGERSDALRQLVVPLIIEMRPRPATIAVTELTARLHLDDAGNPATLVCPPVTIGSARGPIAWSLPESFMPTKHPTELRFIVTLEEIESLERYRRRSADGRLSIHLHLGPVCEGLSNFNEQVAGQERRVDQWTDPTFGIYSSRYLFWTSSIRPLALQVERTAWVERVLPGLGYDRQRVIEVHFPPPLPPHASAASEFDAARQALDEGRYADCVGACRSIIGIWEKEAGATKERPLAPSVAERLGWSEGDLRLRFLDDLWRAANDLSNLPHHREHQSEAVQPFGAADAKLFFQLVVSLSEFLGDGLLR